MLPHEDAGPYIVEDSHPQKPYPLGTPAMRIIAGQRWSLQIVGRLMGGPARFSTLRREISGISANLLARRLDELITIGVIEQISLPAPACVSVYALTKSGSALRDAILALECWEAAHIQ